MAASFFPLAHSAVVPWSGTMASPLTITAYEEGHTLLGAAHGAKRLTVLQVLCAVCRAASSLLGPVASLKALEDSDAGPRLVADGLGVLEILDVRGGCSQPFVAILGETVRRRAPHRH